MRDLVVITSPVNGKMVEKETNFLRGAGDGALGTNKPFTRHAKILEALHSKDIVYNEDFTKAEREVEQSGVVDGKYLEFLREAFSSYEKATTVSNCKSPIDGGLVNYYFTGNMSNIEKLPYHLRCG